MYKRKNFLAIIPARGGSKGIPRKNIFEVNGLPLIQYTIDEAKKSEFLDRVVVSTDDKEIEEVVRKIGGEVPFLRPSELATDNSKTIDAMLHVINGLEEAGENYDYVVLLQPTQPLRKSWHIDEAIKKIVDTNQNSLVSVSEVNDHPILIRTINSGGNLETLLKRESTLRRQEFPSYYKVNGAIYINRLDENFNQYTSLNDNLVPYIMEKEYDIDIDNPIDLEMFKVLLTREG
ncbi:cytidylyltransferase domain-containing protein [Peribacillus asahii]|uniref:acylneuraminate cytidylyltransferase family protein n=1 Tax=Peribacillus asahii TaxID=228899 RepID=UPI00207ACF22|nr:acylneuraminate cytidylyltransferase family protein [Peribacillus asahii]USK59569.1 acylneuraminate cytidylyltransferase family protein [Peribacillus asahii]